jgi:hypothetical protein
MKLNNKIINEENEIFYRISILEFIDILEKLIAEVGAYKTYTAGKNKINTFSLQQLLEHAEKQTTNYIDMNKEVLLQLNKMWKEKK